MKKIITYLLTVAMCISVCSCGKKEQGGAESAKNKIGDTVATDILELTLDDAQFTVAVSNSSKNWGEPKEYNATDDAKNPYVAAKGHTLVYVSFTLNNLDRDSINIDGSFGGNSFIKAKYQDQTYDEDIKYVAERVWGEVEWAPHSSSNILLLTGEKISYRGYMDIPVEAKEGDSFDLTFCLPTSGDSTTEFSFGATAEDSAAAAENEKKRIDEIVAENNKKIEARKTEASPEIVAAVQAAVEGSWDYTTYASGSAIRNELIFDGNNGITVYTTSLGTTFEKVGTYTVCEKDIFVDFYDALYLDCFIPYTLENGSITLSEMESIN